MRRLPIEYAVRNLGHSPVRLVLLVLGSATVLTLVIAAAAFVRGMDAALRSTGGPHNVVLVGAGSEESFERSEVDSGAAGEIAASLRGIRSRAGTVYLSPEVHAQLPLKVRADQIKGPLAMIRGVVPAAMLVHESVQIVDGRFPETGADEVMIGRMTATKLGVPDADLAIGKTMIIDHRSWTIVGRFAAPGTVIDAEVWVPLTDLKQAAKRSSDSCLVLTLDPTQTEFADVAALTKTRVDLQLASVRETDYYRRLADFLAPIRMVAWVTAGLIAVGGLFGGMNTMYAAFASRARELAALQSIGFRRSAILISLIQESLLATITGALIASAIGVLVLNGAAVRFSMGAFGLRVDSTVLLAGLISGIAMGLFGALPPAWRCLRLEIPVALKAV
ncbi:MAG: ABC transporter permease [Phycisphaerae bacterium]|nr:ABC transporter permease [Phycisphaerae bacterium]